MHPLSASQIHQFQKQGYLVISGVYDPAKLLAARLRLEAMFAASSGPPDLLLDPYQHG